MVTLERTNRVERAFNKPAYHYIRESDHLPTVEASAATRDPLALVKIFDPTGSWTWYIAAYDPDSHQAYGLVNGFEAEFGYIDMGELVRIRGQFGLPLERDLHWKPRRLSECASS